MDQKNLIIELRRRVNALETTQNVFVDIEPKSPKTNTVWVRSGSWETKYFDGKNWVIGWGWLLTDWNTSVAFSATDYRTIAWAAWVVSIGTRDTKIDYATTSGNFTMTQTTYFYWQADNPTAIQTTTTAWAVVVAGWVLLAVGRLNPDTANKASLKAFGWPTVDQIIADEIVANSITANMIQANAITSAKLATTLLYAWSITLDTNGLIKWGQSAYDTWTGFFLWYSGATYKFSIGNSAGNKLTWDGSSLAISWTITATSWTIWGTTISATALTGGIIQTSSWTGQRIVIESNLFKSYDSSNVLRVQTANAWMRITDSTWVYSSDFSAWIYDPGGINWAFMQISDTVTTSNRVWLRTEFIAWKASWTTTLDLYLRWWSLSFKGINNTWNGVVLTSPDSDTLALATKISFNWTILEKIGTDLYWNGVKIN